MGLWDTEDKRCREYIKADCTVADKTSKEYVLIEICQRCGEGTQNRCKGYIRALGERR